VQRQFALVLAERVSIGREIHDTLLQSLVGIALQLDALSDSLKTVSQTARDRLLDMRDQLEEHIRDARQSIWELRSSGLQRSDLPTALREMGHRATVDTSTRFEFTVSGFARPCPWDVERQLLRIAQEALSNSLRHAQAQNLQVALEYGSDSVRLNVADDGCGFVLDDEEPPGDCGLAIMRERAEYVGGNCTIVTLPGHGTTV